MLRWLVSVNRETAENAARTRFSWTGGDPTREGPLDTPARVVRSDGELFAGELDEPLQILSSRRTNACA